jgi:protein-disulfide isomerase
VEEKSHEHKEHHHEHHSHEKKDEKISFTFSKLRLWQSISTVLAILVVVLWMFPDLGKAGDAQVAVPSGNAPSPTPQAPTRLDNVDTDDDPVLGDKNAPVTIVSFEDYQCPFCKRAFDQTLPQLKQEYIDTGKVKLVYRDFPLGFHPEANPAAEASECADDQGKFWEYHDQLFNNQQTLGRDLYIKLAGDLGLDVDKFTQCIDNGETRQEVQADTNYGQQVGVSGTPTFFINGIKLVGAQPYAAFKQIIDAELSS